MYRIGVSKRGKKIMIKINFFIERLFLFICGLIFLSFIVIFGLLEIDCNIFFILGCCLISIIFFLLSFSYTLAYNNESFTITALFIKRTYQFKEIKTIYVFICGIYYISLADSKVIAICGFGEKKKLFLLFKAIKEKQPLLEIIK